MGSDSTEHRRTEAALDESERRLRHLIETAEVVPYTWDCDARRYLYVGPQAQKVFGYPIEQWTDESFWLSHIVPEDREAADEHTTRFNDRPHDEHFEYRFITAAGRVVWVRDIIKVEPRADGRRIGYGMMFDVTESKLRDQQLARAHKLEALGQLTGGVAHDFNNLLTVIMGNLEMLEDAVAQDGGALELVRMSRRAAQRGADLTRRLLTVARRQVLQARLVDVNDLVSGMADLLRRTLGETIAVNMRLAAELWPTRIDSGQLESALLNLAVNARDAMPAGGTLTIETENLRLDEDYAGGPDEVAPGDYLRLRVSDTGTGMSAAVMARAFDPFFTTKGSGKGTGLGLSMVYGFVKQSGGHVSIYSAEGHGTTISLYLPSADEHPPEAGTMGGEQESVGGRETILLVEDDDDVRGTVTTMLGGLGYRVLAASNGPSALTVLEANPGIDLLLTDVVMPGGLTGPALAVKARERWPGIKVILASGYAQSAMRQHGPLDPSFGWIDKPFLKHDLARKVRWILDNGRG